jgi:integrase
LVINKELDSLKLKPEKTKPLYLNFKELAQIEKTKNLAEHLENARDWLIISCYTGQRISDFLRFNKDMIRVEKGKSLLEFKQQKTQKLMTIPLHEKVLSILNKRSGDFPRAISDQKYNDYIKTVCEKSDLKQMVMGKKQTNIEKDNKKPAKIRNVSGTFEKWELVTSHIGRRSFATNFYGQIPTNYLIYVTGHSSESLFLKYIGKSNKDIAMELTKYF